MAPTTIYVKPILHMLAQAGSASAAEVHQLALHGMAHITGGGLTENIIRVVPDGLGIALSSASWKLPAVFDWLQREGNVSQSEMWRTFNCGIGYTLIVARDAAPGFIHRLADANLAAWQIGEIVSASGDRRACTSPDVHIASTHRLIQHPEATWKSSWILAGFLAASCCPVAAADAPYTNFVVAPDTLTFSPATPLHKGDRLLVQSPRMLVNEVLLLVRCVDHCATRKIIRAWNGRSSGKLDSPERVTLLEDGDYYFAANEIPLNLRAINFRGCLHSLPLHVLCSDARPLRGLMRKSKRGSRAAEFGRLGLACATLKCALRVIRACQCHDCERRLIDDADEPRRLRLQPYLRHEGSPMSTMHIRRLGLKALVG